MATITLSAGRVALVDDADYAWLNQFKWSLHGCYAYRQAINSVGLRRNVYMHRLITGAAPGMQVDHINRDGLDNRRANLRIVTHAQNQQNRGAAANNRSTGVRGVRFRPDRGTYMARVQVDYREHYIGTFRTLEEADAAVRAARARLMTHSLDAAGIR